MRLSNSQNGKEKCLLLLVVACLLARFKGGTCEGHQVVHTSGGRG